MRWKEQVQEARMKNQKVNLWKWQEMRAMEVMRVITMIRTTNEPSAGPACPDILDLWKTASLYPTGHKTTGNISYELAKDRGQDFAPRLFAR